MDEPDIAEAVLEAVPSATIAFDPQSLRIVFVNSAAVAQYGYSRVELVSMTAAELRAGHEVPALVSARAPADRRVSTAKHRRKDGALLDVEVFTHDARIGGRDLRISTAIDVTARLELVGQLEEEHLRLRTVLSHAPVVIFATDAQGIFTVSEGRGLAAVGLAPGELVGRSALELYANLELEDASGQRVNGAEVLARVLQGGRFAGFSTAGETVYDTRIDPLRDAQGRPAGLIGVATDVSDSSKARAVESQERFRAAFETIPDAINIGRAADGVNIAVNPGFCRLTGWSEAEAVGVTSTALDLWCEPAVREALLAQLAREGVVRNAEVRFRARDGVEFIGLVSSQIFRIGGRPHFLTVTHDITERKRAERAQAAIYRIAEAANTSSTLQDMLREIHGIVSELMPAPNFYIALRDPETEQLAFPYFVDQLGGIPAGPVTPAKGLTGYVLRTGQPLALNDRAGFDALLARGEVQQVGEPSTSWVGVPLRTQDRTVGVLAAQIYDGAARYDQSHTELLTFVSTQVARAIERKQGEEALRASEQRFRALIGNSSDGIMVIDAAGLSLFGSASVNRLLGEGAEAPGLPILELVHPEDFAQVQKAWAEILARPGVPVTVVARLRHRDGSFRDFESVVVNRLDDPAVRGVVSNFRDITERRQMEARLVTADRMVSVGTLAAGVAHEINNPLAYMITNLDYLAEKLPRQDPDLNEALREVREGAERVRVIVRDLKTFSRGDDVKNGPVELHRVLDASCNLAWNELRHRARLVKDYSGALPPALGNESRLGQVFLNLLINAAQAIPEGAAHQNQIRISARAGGGHLTVEVSDSGVGIAPEHLSRLFDPFFTTKPIGVGTGLGLFICRNIVNSLGGELTVSSELGKGTTMRVVLRLADEAAAAPAAKPAATHRLQRGRLLVIDDERLIGQALVRSLPEHEVVADTSAQAALARIRAEAPFDLILCDLMMPETTGVGFFEQLEEEAPALLGRVVFMTGGAFTPAARTFLERVANPRLDKPLDVERIRALLAQRLRGG